MAMSHDGTARQDRPVGGTSVDVSRWRGRRVALVGMGISNRALARFLVAESAQVTGFDSKSEQQLGSVIEEMAELGVPVIAGPNYLEAVGDGFDAVFLTPGIDRRQAPLERLRRSGAWISSEMELFFHLCPAPIIGVTGSSGKTTTTSLIAHILRAGPKPVWVGGNIGRPLIEDVRTMEKDGWAVVELSSFQLEFLTRSPHVGVFTNLTPNHLDVHPSFEAYGEAKGRLFAFQTPSDWAVYNADDEGAARWAAASPGTPFPFSRRRTLPQGAFLRGDRLVVRGVDGRETEMAALADLRIPGWHNVENALAAVAVAHIAGIEPEAVREALRRFEGVPHRLERVAVVDGVTYVNDSIATSPARTVAALASFQQPIVLLAGGSDKNLPFEPMARAVLDRPVKAVVVYGATAEKIARAIEGEAGKAPGRHVPVHRAHSFEEAFHRARAEASPGDVVLLSPACASYDMFPNFEVRGETFRRLVAEVAQAVGAGAAVPRS